MQYTEVEQKYQVKDIAALKTALEKRAAKPGSTTRQVDTYYNAPHRDFLAPDTVSEWLRLRESDHGDSVNYKQWLPAGAVIKTHCDEFETPVEDIEALRRTLQALDFTILVTVEKVREEWVVPGLVEVAFDTVTGAGDFVEFEFKGEAADAEAAIAQLDTFIASLDVELGERINRGYPHILLGREH
ncbi:class IV adenylate cyclase [Sphaerimonospora cavernae]|uniref:Class IV adenylate cyclase n=1 Tax=Sphaerimonospora cavernae TaxID=1740611 RepID=A0ABV6UDX8_9ACTN